MNPPPSDLSHSAQTLTAEELFWITKNGIRMTGMPAWAPTHEDEDLWGMAGLLHDLDWERYPDEHPHRGLRELEERGYPMEIIRAVETHAPNRTGKEPESLLERVLFACDELSGLVYACCLVRPNGIDDLSPKSVTKKLKDKAFAAGVDRDDVARGVELLGIERAEHIQNVIDGMRTIGDVLGIRAEDKL